MILFGGKNDQDENTNDVWEYDLTRNIWHKIEITGDSPPASEDHAAIFDPISYRMIIHGGENGPTWNHTWALDLNTYRWRNMTHKSSPAREDHTAIFDSRGKRMVIFGGKDNDYTNIWEVWSLDLDPSSPTFEQWLDLTVEENHAPGRSDHIAVYDSLKNRMIIYGGWDKDFKQYFGDTWAFNFDANKWKRIKTKKSSPPKRRHVVGAIDPNRNWLIIAGGFGEQGYLNDVWAFDLMYDTWLNITPGPQPRLDHQAIFDPVKKSVVIYGGDARLPAKFHDLWEIDIRPDIPVMDMLKIAGLKKKKLRKIIEKYHPQQ